MLHSILKYISLKNGPPIESRPSEGLDCSALLSKLGRCKYFKYALKNVWPSFMFFLMMLTNGVIHVRHHFPDSIVVFGIEKKRHGWLPFFKSEAFFRGCCWSVILWIGTPHCHLVLHLCSSWNTVFHFDKKQTPWFLQTVIKSHHLPWKLPFCE